MSFGGLAPLPLRLGGDATRGWGSAQHARVAADMAAIVRAADFAVVTVTQTSAIAAAVDNYNGQNGVGLAHAPTIIGVLATGTYVLGWTGSYDDPYGIAGGIRLRGGVGTGHGSAAVTCTVFVTAPNQLTVRTFNAAGTLVNTTASILVT
jgi:hypothetical protein